MKAIYFMLMTDLHNIIIKYVELLKLSKTSEASHWTIEFIQQCKDWCILVEVELSTLDTQDREQCLNSVRNQLETNVPTLDELLDAQHYFYKTLLESKYLNNQVYYYVLSHYEFLSCSEKDVLQKDLSSISNKSTTGNILQDILNDLNNA